jgi:hypothetical protein
MIVLDDHLDGIHLSDQIAHWYPGPVRILRKLRPQTIIKDESVPTLLRELADPVFVTLDTAGFWKRIAPDPAFCIVCIDIPDTRTDLVSPLLRKLMSTPGFRSKADRRRATIRISENSGEYCKSGSKQITQIDGWM